MKRINTFHFISCLIFSLIGFSLMLKGLINVESIFNSEFIFGIFWLFYALVHRTTYMFDDRIKKLEEKK